FIMKKSALICLFLVIVSSLRAFQLYWTSTIELRTDNTHAWLLSKKLIKEDINKNKIYANNTIQVGNELENTFFFIQITDLHLSRYRGKGHTQHFLHFIQSILPVVRPEFVVVTGDLTDAKDKKRITSQQYIDEWTVYQTAIKEKVSLDWYDMRGNHDCFNLPSWKSRVNYFRTHGNSADMVEQGKGIYTWQIKQPYSEYQFIAMDACPKRGPSRPLNFFGYLTSRTMDRLETALTSKTYNHTFVFSHYPTTSMVFGLGDVLQSYDPVTKSLELELGDMKEHGLYRIFAVDHDLLSFVDIELPLKQITAEKLDASGLIYPMKNDSIVWPEPLNLSPAILVTNPKDSRYSIPSKEPLWRTKESTHIRFFVFSQHAPEDLQVTLWIDGAIHLEKATFIGTTQKPMWTSPWDPTLYDDRKKHQLVVEVITPDEKKSTSSIPFRIDTQRIKMGGGSGEFIIKSHMTTVVREHILLALSLNITNMHISHF
ncbi:Metallo-dependent phosphatase-like protein, partial [Pilobolus umbonatus]